jgi:hypothetical protein
MKAILRSRCHTIGGIHQLPDCGGNKDMLYSQFTGKAESLLIVQGFQLQVKFAKFMTALFVKIVVLLLMTSVLACRVGT